MSHNLSYINLLVSLQLNIFKTIAMESSKISAILFICMLFISSVTPILGCGTCGKPTKPKTPKAKTPKTPKTPTPSPVTLPPVGKLPPVKLPPVGTLPPVGKLPLPPVGLPPVTLPPVGKLPLPPVGTLPPVGKLPLPPVGLPPVTLPPVGKLPLPPVGTLPPVGKLPLPPVTLPPVGKLPLPPVGLPPVTLPPVIGGSPPKTKGKDSCPIDILKLGACVDLLGGLVHIGLADPAVNKCCPILSGLAEIEAAACLCTTLKIKLLNLKVYVPIALQVLLTCGKNPPPGYDCSI
ncbi:hypothetical protein MKW98_024336 [Papaver atlanticum]|uniref:Bifunctional inhibitor/plant lipid transfer protein/seed storage helical domain-containing protein n=1 Tax=Papaver atlanticum TaxID=357466 RepID=A0AAD4T0N6_9MAGN|nr:hypothetical protein MKW98_024336 [Papaver atlanticum]